MVAGCGNHNLVAAVLTPARLLVARAHRALEAVRDRRHAVGGDAALLDVALDGGCAAHSQCEIVLVGPALVGVPFDAELQARIVAQDLHLPLQQRRLARANLVAIELEVYRLEQSAARVLGGAIESRRAASAAARARAARSSFALTPAVANAGVKAAGGGAW